MDSASLFSDDLCRICAFESEENEPLFQAADSTITESGRMFTSCLSIKLDPKDGFPTSICFRCNTQLRMFSEFRKGALYMHTKFEAKLQARLFEITPINVKTEPNVVEVIETKTPDVAEEECETLLEILCGKEAEDEAESQIDKKETIAVDRSLKISQDSDLETDDHYDISYVDDSNFKQSPSMSDGDEYEEEMDVVYLEDGFMDEEGGLVDSSSQPEQETEVKSRGTKRKANHEATKLVIESMEYVSCDKCNKRIKLSVKNHICISDQLFSCDICSREFVTKQRRDTHQARHTDERPIGCELCEKFFKNKYDLKVHHRSHGDVRSYVCDICGRAFRAHSHLANHVQSHAEENIYECDYCNQRYKTPITLLRHITSMHTKKDEFKCEVCSKSFGLKFRYQRHMKIHNKHDNEQYHVDDN